MKLLVVGEKTSVTEGPHESAVMPTGLRPWKKVSPAARAGAARVGEAVNLTTSELETHLVRAITARTHGQVQVLTVQILGGQTVLGGFAESYYAVQLAVVGLQEAMDALGLDRPGRVDLNIEVMPRLSAKQ